MSKKNVVLLTDYTDTVSLIRIYGPYKLAYELRQHNIDVTVVNFLHMWAYDELIEYLDKIINDDTLFVGFNTFFYRSIEGQDVYGEQRMEFKPIEPGMLLPHGRQASQDLHKWLKDRNQVLALGGATGIDMQENSVFDYVFRGFGEKSVLNFINHLTTGAELVSSYKSVYGPIIVNDINVEQNFDFANSSFRWDERDCVLPGEVLNIEVARGCIFKCNFCSFPMIGKKKFDYIKDFEILKGELIDNYERFGTTRYFFSDETFNDSVQKVELIQKISQELPFKLEYFAYLRLDLLDRNPETIEMLYNSGLRYTHFGIETLNPAAGKTIGKSFTFEKAKKAIDHIKQVSNGNLNLHGTFMVGLPHDTESSILETYKHIKSRDIALDSFYFLPLFIPRDPFPQSEFGRNYSAYGYQAMDPNDPVWGEQIRKLSNFAHFPGVIWQRQDSSMNFFTAEKLANSLNESGLEFKKLGHIAALGVSGLNIAPEHWEHKTYAEVNWPWISRVKQERALEYKKLMNKMVG